METNAFPASRKNGIEGVSITQEDGRLVMEDVATRTEIGRNGRAIRKTWMLMGLAHSRTYVLDDHAAVQIIDKGTVFEGYTIITFGVYLISKGRKIRLSSTGDLKQARLIQGQITEFLKESRVGGMDAVPERK
jgi:hypothetical protein